MEIGSKIRELRQQKNLTQEELGDRCDLTKGYISQLENDLSSPSIATLSDILLVLGSNLSDFFDKIEDDDKVVFGDDDYIKKCADNLTTIWLVPNSQKYSLEPIEIVISPHSSTPLDTPHDGEEFGYVLQGKATVVLGKKKYIAKASESFYYKADKIHYLINDTDDNLRILWVSCPPNF
ncbi:MAG: helix-turn-helix domain-containing protein [Firmicutes bacterium]|nr:helix-turn-helix domain-containing protein [Bacillota bacterium]MCL1953783.1 helix-turn-helix domain-containing protein [Bacillota bacterium]